MISESHTRYGSRLVPGRARQGSARRWRSYQASKALALATSRIVFVATACFRCNDFAATLITDGVTERSMMDKPRNSQVRALADAMRSTLNDAFAKQGFAST